MAVSDLGALLAAYDAMPAEGRAAYLWGLADSPQVEELARALTRRHLGRPLQPPAPKPGPPVELPPVTAWPPSAGALVPCDDAAVERLLRAVCAWARHDARTGNKDAAAWLAALGVVLPRPARRSTVAVAAD